MPDDQVQGHSIKTRWIVNSCKALAFFKLQEPKNLIEALHPTWIDNPDS